MNLMTDLETLGTNTHCPVITIGAVFFDVTGLKEEFECNLNLDQQIKDGRQVDAATVKWWMGQEMAARKVFKEKTLPVKKAWLLFLAFCSKYPKINPWGNGATFDISIVEDSLKQYDVPVPWNFWDIRDMRTFKEYNCKNVNIPFEGIAHNALADAKHQALVVIEGLKRLS